jgi:hypothetical protein
VKIVQASDETKVVLAETAVGATGVAWKTDSTTVLEITNLLNDKDPLDVKVKLTEFKDASIRSNPMGDKEIALKLLDTKKPTMSGYFKITPNDADGKDAITFYFSEAMKAETISSLSNYILTSAGNVPLSTIEGAALKAVASDGKSVTFRVNTGTITSATKFKVYAVQDLADNYMDGYASQEIQALQHAPAFTPPTTAAATAKNKVEFVFTNDLGTIDYTAFSVKIGDKTYYAKGGDLKSGTTTTAVIEFWDTMPADVAGAVFELTLSRIKNAYGVAIADTGTTTGSVIDKIAPTATVATGPATTPGSIKISFDETVKGTDIAIYKDKLVSGYTTAYFNSADAVVDSTAYKYIIISGLEVNKSYTVVVNGSGNIKDVSAQENAANFLNTTVTSR